MRREKICPFCKAKHAIAQSTCQCGHVFYIKKRTSRKDSRYNSHSSFMAEDIHRSSSYKSVFICSVCGIQCGADQETCTCGNQLRPGFAMPSQSTGPAHVDCLDSDPSLAKPMQNKKTCPGCGIKHPPAQRTCICGHIFFLSKADGRVILNNRRKYRTTGFNSGDYPDLPTERVWTQPLVATHYPQSIQARAEPLLPPVDEGRSHAPLRGIPSPVTAMPVSVASSAPEHTQRVSRRKQYPRRLRSFQNPSASEESSEDAGKRWEDAASEIQEVIPTARPSTELNPASCSLDGRVSPYRPLTGSDAMMLRPDGEPIHVVLRSDSGSTSRPVAKQEQFADCPSRVLAGVSPESKRPPTTGSPFADVDRISSSPCKSSDDRGSAYSVPSVTTIDASTLLVQSPAESGTRSGRPGRPKGSKDSKPRKRRDHCPSKASPGQRQEEQIGKFAGVGSRGGVAPGSHPDLGEAGDDACWAPSGAKRKGPGDEFCWSPAAGTKGRKPGALLPASPVKRPRDDSDAGHSDNDNAASEPGPEWIVPEEKKEMFSLVLADINRKILGRPLWA